MNILLALDSSTKAMEEAVRLARALGAGLTALFVMDDTWNVYIGHDFLSGSNARAGFLESIRDSEHDSRDKTLQAFKAAVGDHPAEIKTAIGDVCEEIINELREKDYAMLVMSQPFRRGLEVVRDATARMVKDAPCTVVLVK